MPFSHKIKVMNVATDKSSSTQKARSAPKVFRVGTAGRSAQEFGKRMDYAIEQKVKDSVRYTRWLSGANA